jgi:hypothetical protein
MTPEQLRYYINQLAASGREQSHTGNFGVGAKVAAGSRNPHGLECRSSHQGQGALLRFMRHRDGRWGTAAAAVAQWPPQLLAAAGRARQAVGAAGQSHGTPGRIARPARTPRHRHPTALTGARQQWITRYLNRRFVTAVQAKKRHDFPTARRRWCHAAHRVAQPPGGSEASLRIASVADRRVSSLGPHQRGSRWCRCDQNATSSVAAGAQPRITSHMGLILAYGRIPVLCRTLHVLADPRLKRTTGLEPATFGLGSPA